MLSRAQKEEAVKDLNDQLSKAKAVFLTNLIGLSSNDAVKLRKDVREAKGNIVITRNTLIERAAAGTMAEEMLKGLKGTNAVAVAFEDAPGVAKALHEAGKEFDVVELRDGVLDGTRLEKAQLVELASLPSRDEMLGTLLATFQAPVSAFARLMNSIKDEVEKQGVESPSQIKVEAAAE